MKYTLGIDPGYDRLGVAIIDSETKPNIVFSECFSPKKTQTYQEKIHSIGTHITDIIQTYNPQEISIEQIFFTNNQKTAMDVSAVRGAIIYCAMKEKVSVFEYSPTQIKMAVTGFGKSNKQQIKKMVSLLTNIQEDTKRLDDEIDAIAIALTHTVIQKKVYV